MDRDCTNCKHHINNSCEVWECEFSPKMSREEVIKMLQTEKECVERQERKQKCNRYCEACDLCMPIEKVIEGYNMAISALSAINSPKTTINPEETELKLISADGDLISRQSVIDKIRSMDRNDHIDEYTENVIEYFENMPSAEKTAKYKCNHCGWEWTNCELPICPNCGSKMKGE